MKLFIILLLFTLTCSSPRREMQTTYSTVGDFSKPTEAEKSSFSKKQINQQQRILTYKGYITIEIENESSVEVKKKLLIILKK